MSVHKNLSYNDGSVYKYQQQYNGPETFASKNDPGFNILYQYIIVYKHYITNYSIYFSMKYNYIYIYIYIYVCMYQILELTRQN